MDYGAIAIIAKRNRYVRIFRKADALSPQKTISPVEHGIRDSFVFRKLVRQGIFVRVNEEKYYLDENRYSLIKRIKLRIVILLTILVILTFAIVCLIGYN
jgi:hypothetical protein